MTTYHTHPIYTFSYTAPFISYINQVNKIHGLIIIWKTSRETDLSTNSYNTFKAQKLIKTIYTNRIYKSRKPFYPNYLSKKLIILKNSVIYYICKKTDYWFTNHNPQNQKVIKKKFRKIIIACFPANCLQNFDRNYK